MTEDNATVTFQVDWTREVVVITTHKDHLEIPLITWRQVNEAIARVEAGN